MAIRKPTQKTLIQRELCRTGKHPKGHIVTEWNRKGQEFRECDVCEAFLGFTGRKRAKT